MILSTCLSAYFQLYFIMFLVSNVISKKTTSHRHEENISHLSYNPQVPLITFKIE